MQSKAKSNSVVTTTRQPDGTFVFHVAGAGEVKFDPSRASDVNRNRAEEYGWNVRLTREAALPRDPKTGLSAPASAKLAAIRALAEHLMSGSEDWSPKREARGAAGPRFDPIILAAVVEATGRTEAEIVELIGKGAAAKGVEPKAYLAALGTGAKVAPIVERMRAEQASATELDADAELDGLMGE
jgi:hypothetical protein